MKLKKLLALGLTTVMTAGLLVGCGSSSDDHLKMLQENQENQ